MYMFACLTLLALAADAAPQPKPKLALLPFRVVRMAADLGPALDSHLAGAVDAREKYDMVTPDDINAMLGLERMKDAVACTDTACAAEIGGALGVEFLMSPQATALGDTVEITITLIDVHHAAVLARKQGRVPNEERFLAQGIDAAVEQLVGTASHPADPHKMVLHITGSAENVYEVSVDTGDDSAACENRVTLEKSCTLQVPRAASTLTARPATWLRFPTHIHLAGQADGYTIALSGTGSVGLTALSGTALGLGFITMVGSTIAFTLDGSTAGFIMLGSGIAVAALGGWGLYVGLPRDTSTVETGGAGNAAAFGLHARLELP